jgi:aromatic-L-amino-acid decarboxylase
VTPEDFKKHGHDLIDWIADYIENIEQQRVTSIVKPGDVRARLTEHPPATPDGFDALMADTERVVVPGLTHWQHPNFFAYFPANSSYPAILGDLLTAGLGVQGMSWVTGPACTEIETLMVDWMHELLGLPECFRSTSASGGGVIHGSASEATLASILAARWRITDGVVNTDGDTSRLVGYATSQAHSSIEKGLRIAGIGTDRLRVVPHDSTFAMRPEALAELCAADRAAGLIPFWVCSAHGTTSSMAFDPTVEIAEIAHREGMWLHVDGAMSGIAALAPEHRWVNAGLERADSYCTNPHKWMGINFDCDLFWTADRAALLGALSILPEYLRSQAAESGAAIDYRDWQVPLGRRFRSLKLWFHLRIDGVEGVKEMIREHVRLTQLLGELVAADDRFEIVAPHPLNLLCLAVRDGDAATDRLIEQANATGTVLFTRTVLDGRSVLRFSIGARATQERHVRAGWSLLQQLV